MMANQSQCDRIPVRLYERLVQFGDRVSWPLFVITLEGIGLVGLTIALWLRGFDVLGRAPLLIVLVVLWFIAEVLVWAYGDWS